MASPSAPAVTVRLPPELGFLLRPRDRAARERRLGYDPDATVAHVVQAAGVPAQWLRLELTARADATAGVPCRARHHAVGDMPGPTIRRHGRGRQAWAGDPTPRP